MEDRKLRLGPIVGHTDDSSATIWICVEDDASNYKLAVSEQRKTFGFTSTEGSKKEFGTAIAVADGLRSNYLYNYRIFRRDRPVLDSGGSFSTMPKTTEKEDIPFVFLSCSDNEHIGQWNTLYKYIQINKPRFLLMLGDVLYVDGNSIRSNEGWKNVWSAYFNGEIREEDRKQAIAQKYIHNWSREPIRTIMANIPIYMMWDDHDIRDGWGSRPPDSPTLAEKYPKGTNLFNEFDKFFKDLRETYWHFQMSHNSRVEKYEEDSRTAMPYSIRCGRLMVLVLDSRGARDIWREDFPILGEEQWTFLNETLDNLEEDIDAIAIATTAPIAGVRRLPGRASSAIKDVRWFKNGKESKLRNHVIWRKGTGDIYDDYRDQWSHELSRNEQKKLISKIKDCRNINRSNSNARKLIFLGGDLHCGSVHEIRMWKYKLRIPLIVSSSINQKNSLVKIKALLPRNDSIISHSKPRIVSRPATYTAVRDGIILPFPTVAYIVQQHNFGTVKLRYVKKNPEVSYELKFSTNPDVYDQYPQSYLLPSKI